MPVWLIAALPSLIEGGKELYSIISDSISGKITSADEFHDRVNALVANVGRDSAAYRAMRAGTGPGSRP